MGKHLEPDPNSVHVCTFAYTNRWHCCLCTTLEPLANSEFIQDMTAAYWFKATIIWLWVLTVASRLCLWPPLFPCCLASVSGFVFTQSNLFCGLSWVVPPFCSEDLQCLLALLRVSNNRCKCPYLQGLGALAAFLPPLPSVTQSQTSFFLRYTKLSRHWCSHVHMPSWFPVYFL